MLEFPQLKTGVRAQYPLEKELLAWTKVFRFLDGRQQRFPVKKMRKRWRIQLDQLDEKETAVLEEFARRHRETAEPFRFTDPMTGSEHWPCHLEGGEHTQFVSGPARGGTVLVVVEGEE